MRRSVLACIGFSAFAAVLWGEAPQDQKTKPVPQSEGPPAPAKNAARFAFGGNAAEVPATFIEDIVHVPVTINESKPSLFVLDTTQAEASIDPARAKEIGVQPDQALGLALPGVIFPFDSLPVRARPELASEIGRSYEGTLGGDFLSRVVVEIDYARQTMRVFDPRVYKYAGKGVGLPLSVVAGVPVIRAKLVNPRGKQFEADYALDTTLVAGVLVSQRFSDAHRVFPPPGKKVKRAYDPQLTGGEDVALFRLRQFEIARWPAADIIAELSRSKRAGMDQAKLAGVIGAAFLRRFNIVFDYPHQKIFFEPNTHFGDYDEEDKSGMAVVAKGPNLKTFEIVHVVPGTPAAQAGIHTGDIIEGINNEAAADMTLASVRDLFRQVGYKYQIVIERGEQSKTVTIETRRLL
ncbi:MAG TPA: PDZ domain-containing protein [Candidatus Cybelea sp.]|nr:PDZ domain-containing protein [Candidatus Cybelea sp.]